MLHAAALLDSEQSRAADRAAIADGATGEALMENAGRAVADLICEAYAPCPTLVVCGTGNNGGDGFVVSRILRERGWPVTAALMGNEKSIEGPAVVALHRWEEENGRILLFDDSLLQNKALIVDALYGTGLSRNVSGGARDTVEAINRSKIPVVAIDIPSGINASTGDIMGCAVRATHTVTFVRPKLGHVLLPGKAFTGGLHVFDIGISGDGLRPDYFLNTPALWHQVFVMPRAEDHKYSRGHTLVMGGGVGSTGATKLAALGALRAGSGLVSVITSPEALPIYASSLTSVMTKTASDLKQLEALVEEKHTTAVLIGPGCGVNETTREQTLRILAQKKPCVIDADALTIFKNSPKTLFSAVAGPVVLTPHEGEFSRLFDAEKLKFDFVGQKHERTRDAAEVSNSVVVYKGNDTVIASPDGRLAINAEAPVWLATAGSGDVLAGLIAGLLAQGMPAFEAACAGVWIHSRAAAMFGPGLIAEDLPGAIPGVLKALYMELA